MTQLIGRDKKESDPAPEPKGWFDVLIEKLADPKLWKRGSVVIVVVLALVVGTRLYSNFKGPEGDSVNEAVLTVSVEPAQLRSLHRHLEISGTIWSRDPLTVGTELGGLRIDSILVDEGDFVKKGQVLATLNASLLKAELAREEAKLQRAKVSLARTIQPNRPMDIARLEYAEHQATAMIAQEEANIIRAEANLRNAKNNTVRYRALRKEGAVSAEDLDTKETAEKTATADLSSAKQKLRAARFAKEQASEQLKLAREGGSKEDVGIARASVKESEAVVAHYRAQLAQTRITAPTDGWILERMVQLGDISTANQDVFRIVKDNQLEVRAEIPEQDLHVIKEGQKVVCSSVARPGETVTGTVREISPMVDRTTHLARARIDIPFHELWRPGTFVHGVVDLGAIETLTVPHRSVLDVDGRKVVYVLDDNKVFSRVVKVGERSDDYVEILDGLKRKEIVVTSGGAFLKDGDIVRVGKDHQGKGATSE